MKLGALSPIPHTARVSVSVAFVFACLFSAPCAHLAATDKFDPLLPYFMEETTDEEIFANSALPEPLVPMAGAISIKENEALGLAILDFTERKDSEDMSALTGFLRAYPNSRWRPALELNLGLVYLQNGYFSRALTSFQSANTLSKGATTGRAKLMADRALGEYALMLGRLGRTEELRGVIAEARSRPLAGAGAVLFEGALQGLSGMSTDPGTSYRCGPFAVEQVLRSRNPKKAKDLSEKERMRSDSDGTSVKQLLEYQKRLGLDLIAVRRPKGASIPLPAVVHWRVGHFAALIEERDGRYLSVDPTFQQQTWISIAGLDAEASGVMLVSEDQVPREWARKLSDEELQLRGKGLIFTIDPHATKPWDIKVGGGAGGADCRGMAVYSLHALLCSVNIMDTPLSYAVPYGPTMDFTVTYNHKEAGQPSNFNYSNFGSKWTHNWHAYVEDTPGSPSANVKIFVRGGGMEVARDFNSVTNAFLPQQESQAVLVRVAANPIRYERTFPDGSKEVYERSDGGTTTRRILLTRVIDPVGNSATLNYAFSSLRLDSITDATGTIGLSLSYQNASDPLKITRVTDKYGRYATFDYSTLDGVPKLTKITDPVAIESSFAYAPGTDFIASMTTPYGTTGFSAGYNYQDQNLYTPWVEVTLADGSRERAEFRNSIFTTPGYSSVEHSSIFTDLQPKPIASGFLVRTNQTLQYRNTLYWDRKAMAMAPGSISKARIFHFIHGDANTGAGVYYSAVGILEASKEPFESWVWYNYKNQGQSSEDATLFPYAAAARATKAGRVLENGASQVYEYDYNALGLPTLEVDPEGRKTLIGYTADGRYVTEINQQNGSSQDFLGKNEYFTSGPFANTGLIWRTTDASGMVKTFDYTAKGQLKQISDSVGITYFVYGTSGNGLDRLWKVEREGVNPVGPRVTMATYSYDSAGRIASVTNVEGDTTSYTYDNLDRLVRTTYPDTTYEELSYVRASDGKMLIGVTQSRDRLGRLTKIRYNAIGERIEVEDALGYVTKFEWCRCGKIQKLTDPRSTPASPIETHWSYDEQGRLLSKTYPDGKQETYVYESGLSRLKYKQDAKGQRTHYTYDKANSVKTVSYTDSNNQPLNPATPTVIVNYDPVHARPASVSDGVGTTSFTYHPYATYSNPSGLNGRGHVASIDGPYADDTINYSYDILGRQTLLAVGTRSRAITLDYLGRLSAVTFGGPAMRTFTYQYYGSSDRLSSTIYPEFGLRTDFSYHGNGDDRRISQIKNLQDTTVLSQFDYTYDDVGNILTWQRQEGANPFTRYTYTYDNINQLLTATLRDANSIVLSSQSYVYDASRNRTSKVLNGVTTSYSFNVANQMVTAGSRTFTYDNNGNPNGDGVSTYAYDAADRLVNWTRPADASGYTATATFKYDAFSRRVESTYSTGGAPVVQRTVFDGADRWETRNSLFNYAPVVMTDLMTVSYRHWWLGSPTYNMIDHLGSTREAVNQYGLQSRFDYDPWGVRNAPLSPTGYPNSTEDGFQGMDTQPFGGTGQWNYTGYSGVDFSDTRPYDAKDGRWIGRDPLGEAGGGNLYRAFNNNPVNMIDPSGKVPIRPAFAVGLWGNCANQRYLTRPDAFQEGSGNLRNWRTQINDHQSWGKRRGVSQAINPRIIFTVQCPPGERMARWDIEWRDAGRTIPGFNIAEAWKMGDPYWSKSSWGPSPCEGEGSAHRSTVQSYRDRPGLYNISLQLETRFAIFPDIVLDLMERIRPVIDCVPWNASTMGDTPMWADIGQN